MVPQKKEHRDAAGLGAQLSPRGGDGPDVLRVSAVPPGAAAVLPGLAKNLGVLRKIWGSCKKSGDGGFGEEGGRSRCSPWDLVGGARNQQVPAAAAGNGALLPSPVPGLHRAHPCGCANATWRAAAGTLVVFLGTTPGAGGSRCLLGPHCCAEGEGQQSGFSWAVPVPVQKKKKKKRGPRSARRTTDIFSIFFSLYIYIAVLLRVTVATDFILLKPGPACDAVGKEQLRGERESSVPGGGLAPSQPRSGLEPWRRLGCERHEVGLCSVSPKMRTSGGLREAGRGL